MRTTREQPVHVGLRNPSASPSAPFAERIVAFKGFRNSKFAEPGALAVLLGLTALLYVWRLDQNGWANPYYSAAAQSGSLSWTAWFYGSADAGNLVTIDKTPLSVWIIGLSVRLFGLSSLSILLPQALIGVITTWLVYKTIRTASTAAVAFFGAVTYATTPVVLLMSRFNNPEPLMGLLVVAAAFCAVRATTDDRWRWYLFCGAGLGLAFMAKQIQGFFVVPAVFLTVLIMGTSPIRRRCIRLLGTAAMLLITAGWWVAIVELVPTSERPYIGGSASNSALELTTGYNGIARFAQFTNQDGVAVPTSATSPLGTFKAGLSRLFNADFAQESAWLLFASLACAAVLLILRRQTAPKGLSPAALLASVWLLTVVGVLSIAGTMVHSYYTFSLAAPMAIVLSLGLQQLWRDRYRPITRLIGSVVLASIGYLGSRILEYSADWPAYWDILLPAAAFISAILWGTSVSKNEAVVLIPVAMAILLGPVMTDIYTINTPQAGTNPLSGPASGVEKSLSKKFRTAVEGNDDRTLQLAFGAPPDPLVVEKLRAKPEHQTWAAVTVTGQNAALYQLESRKPVAALGGWLGLDPAPTLGKFKALVAEGRVGLFIDQPDLLLKQKVGKETGAIVEWVRDHFASTLVGSQTVYDLGRQKP